MLYNLDWLRKGENFPPTSELARIKKYSDHILLFQGDIQAGFISKEEYVKARQRIKRVVDNYTDIVSYPVDLNYHRIIAIKTADFVCGEHPIITLGKDGETPLKEMINGTNLYAKLYSAAIDIPRFGNGVVRVYKSKSTNKNALVVIDPRRWFKVVDEEDPAEVLNHVLAWVREIKVGSVNTAELNVQIHYKGYYIKKVFSLAINGAQEHTDTFTGQVYHQIETLQIGDQIKADEKVYTGQSDFAIFDLAGLVTSDDTYGKDDYEAIDPILAEIWTRLGQIAIILDKHSNPDMYAPDGAFEKNDSTGKWELKTGGNVFPVGEGESPPAYITWDGQLESNFKTIDLLITQLYRISEMGAVFEASEGTSNIAVETMKARFISVLKKAERITRNIDSTVKKIILALSEVGWKKIDIKELNIEWQDGLPADEGVEINNAVNMINAKLSTPKRENMERFGRTEEVADQIQTEADEQAAATAALMGFQHMTEGTDE